MMVLYYDYFMFFSSIINIISVLNDTPLFVRSVASESPLGKESPEGQDINFQITHLNFLKNIYFGSPRTTVKNMHARNILEISFLIRK